MSDTLRSDLNDAFKELHGRGLGVEAVAVAKAISELDRLEAEVKKPRLPKGFWLERESDGTMTLGYTGLTGCGYRQVIKDTDNLSLLALAFLTTPDLVPSTEPAQAAGDGEQNADGPFISRTVDPLTSHWFDKAPETASATSWGRCMKPGCQERATSETTIGVMRTVSCGAHKDWAFTEAVARNVADTPAEKPKPVSLCWGFKEKFFAPGTLRPSFPANSEYPKWDHFYWLLRTLDQERGV